MSQMRLNPLNGRWVTIVPNRAERPTDFAPRDQSVEDDPARPCPFCPGNEESTPPALETIEEDGNWSMRVIPNRYPAFVGDDAFSVHNLGPVHVMADASGIHEVFVFTPTHTAGLHDLDDEHAGDLMLALERRLTDHAAMEHIRYTQAIVNQGREAGASIAHPHGQILGLPFVPGEVLDEEKAFARFAGGCVLCTTIEAELSADHRVVMANDDVVVVCPYWSGTPYELLIIPREHEPHLQDASERSLRSTGIAVRDALGQLDAALGDISYNLGFHTAPHQHTGQYHWHAHVWPNLVTQAGFERGTGVMINIVAPEVATDTLRAVVARGDRPMSDVTVSIDLDASPAAVWAVVEPIEHHVEWMADAVAIRFETEQTRGIGTEFLCDTKVGPIKLTDRMEITAWVPPTDPIGGAAGVDGAMGVRHTGIVTGSGMFTLEPIDGGGRTRFTWAEDLDFPWFFGGRLGEIVAGKLILGPLWKRNLKALKQLVERRSG